MIEIQALTKVFPPDVVALDRLTVRIDPGQLYVLLGPNGSGKTTLIHILLNFLEPTSGTALVAGFHCHRDAVEVRKRVAYIPEHVAFYPRFTARQNLRLFAAFAGHRVRDAEMVEALATVGLDPEVLDRPVVAFSRGMKQKLAIALAVLKDASVFLLDEPASGLDPQSAREFYRVILGLRDAGRTILLVTHDVFRTRAVADCVGILYRGRLVAEFAKEELAGQDLEKAYLDIYTGEVPGAV